MPEKKLERGQIMPDGYVPHPVAEDVCMYRKIRTNGGKIIVMCYMLVDKTNQFLIYKKEDQCYVIYCNTEEAFLITDNPYEPKCVGALAMKEFIKSFMFYILLIAGIFAILILLLMLSKACGVY